MKKRIIRVFLFLITAFFSLLFKTDVKAGIGDDFLMCRGVAPITFVDHNPLLSTVDIKVLNTNVSFWDAYKGGVLDMVSAITPFSIQYKNNINAESYNFLPNAFVFKFIGTDYMVANAHNLYFGYRVDYADIMYEKKFDWDSSYFNIDEGWCREYTKITCASGSSDCIMQEATKEEYEAFLLNQFSVFDGRTDYMYNYVGFQYDEDFNNEYYIFLKDGIVFKNSYKYEEYPTNNFDKFMDQLRIATKNDGNHYKSEEIEEAKKGLGVIIDIESENKRSNDSSYYDITKDRMKQIMEKEFDNPKAASTKKNIFNQWFYYTGRYVFEEDIDLFKKMVVYIHDNNDLDEITSTQYEHIINAIDGIIEGRDIKKTKENFETDECVAACENCIPNKEIYNTNACSACMASSSSPYAMCKECTPRCENQCSSVPGEKHGDCVEGCMSNCMGSGTYETYKHNRDSYLHYLDDQYQKAANKTARSSMELYNFSLRDPATIEWVKYNYISDCKDVSVFRVVWLILVIGGPFLVIVFGSMDIFRITMSSGGTIGEAIKKNKKKFIRRVIALILLLALPFIIKIIINNLTPSDNKSNNLDLMKCIVNGSK